MKNKPKFIFILLIGGLILSLGYNFYQQNKIDSYKKELSYNVKKNIQKFAGQAGNIDNEVIYAEQYASISYISLSDNNGIPSDEWEYSLPGLFIEIKDVMINDKESFKKAFEGTNESELMFKISDNFEDKDSINKVYKLLSN